MCTSICPQNPKLSIDFFHQATFSICKCSWLVLIISSWMGNNWNWNLISFHILGTIGGVLYFSHFLISGNILCVWTFNKKDVELKPSFANLLKCLSIFDTIFLVSLKFHDNVSAPVLIKVIYGTLSNFMWNSYIFKVSSHAIKLNWWGGRESEGNLWN